MILAGTPEYHTSRQQREEPEAMAEETDEQKKEKEQEEAEIAEREAVEKEEAEGQRRKEADDKAQEDAARRRRAIASGAAAGAGALWSGTKHAVSWMWHKGGETKDKTSDLMDRLSPHLFWPYLIMAIMIHFLDWQMRFPRYNIMIFYTDPMLAFHLGFAGIFFIVFFKQRGAGLWPNIKILGGLMFVGLIAYLFPLISTLLPAFLKFQAVNIAFNPIIHPIWVYFGLITFKQSKWAEAALMIVVLFWTFFIIFQFMSQGTGFGRATINPGDYQTIAELIRDWINGARNFGSMVLTGVWGGFQNIKNETLYMATGGDFYYTGQVDRNAKAKLGVYLDELKAASPQFFDDEPVSVWTTMNAQTLDKPLSINVQCYRYDPTQQTISLRQQIPRTKGKLTPREDFYVMQKDTEDVDCFFDKIKKGRQMVGFKADFDFETQAYYRTYFMDVNRLRSYKIENIDILRQYGITDTNPVAVYTNGPINIGMNFKQPPIGIGTYTPEGGETYTENKFSLRITIDNNWEGKITGISNMIIMVPKGMRLDYNSDGKFYCNEFLFDQISCGNVGIGQRCDDNLNNVYMMRIQPSSTSTTQPTDENQTVKPRQEVNIDKYKAISCPIIVDSPEIVLSQNPITARYFKVIFDYSYSLEKELALNIEASGTTDAGGTPLQSELEKRKIFFDSNVSDQDYLGRPVAVGENAKTVEKDLSPQILQKAKDNNINYYLLKAAMMESGWDAAKTSSDGKHFGIMQISEQSLSQAGISCTDDYKTNSNSSIDCGAKLFNAVVSRINSQGMPLTQKYVIAGYYGGTSALDQSSLCGGSRKFECNQEIDYQTNQYYVNEVGRLYNAITQ